MVTFTADARLYVNAHLLTPVAVLLASFDRGHHCAAKQHLSLQIGEVSMYVVFILVVFLSQVFFILFLTICTVLFYSVYRALLLLWQC